VVLGWPIEHSMSIATLLSELRTAAPLVAPSLLACDFGHLADEVQRVESAGARLLHLDVMDGHFVPNLSIGIPIVEAVRRVTTLPLDVHLMISEPQRYLRPFREAGADLLTVHIEVAADTEHLLGQIHDLGCAAGISLNPPTPVDALRACLPWCDLVLVMSVMPGFGGQQFQLSALEKLRRLRRWGGEKLLLSVDGGVNGETVALCAAAGADVLVVGTGLFSQQDYRHAIAEMTALAAAHRKIQV
jgi:ribulose-phosphate 3-epimerase